MEQTTPTEARVATVPVGSIEPNPHNPRRLFDEEPMRILKESIEKLGILVPLDVYPKTEGAANPETDAFILLDGERRWRCASALALRAVPVIIVQRPTPIRNILTMFHIHNVREAWQLMPTALKLRTIMARMGVRNERKLEELTKLSISQIRRCRVLLTYPKRYQNLMLAPPSERFKSDFFIDLHRIRGPAIADELPAWVERGDSRCIDIMIDKYERDVIKAVTDFRQLASVYQGAKRRKRVDRFNEELDAFFDEPDTAIGDIHVPGASYEKELKEFGRSARRLCTQIGKMNTAALAGDSHAIDLLRRLSDLITRKLEEAMVNAPKTSRPK